MKLWLKSQVGLKEPQEIEVEPTETVGSIKERCGTIQSYDDVSNAVLMHNREVLKDELRLKEYNIQENETIELVPKHTPGAGTSQRGFFPSHFSQRISRESTMIKAQRLPIKPSNPRKWVMHVQATKGKWKGKKYKVLFELPKQYPFKSPKVTWLSKNMQPIHPNIFPRTGFVCFYMFKANGWRPYYTLISCYHGIIWLLENPNYEEWRGRRFQRLLNDLRTNSFSRRSI